MAFREAACGEGVFAGAMLALPLELPRTDQALSGTLSSPQIARCVKAASIVTAVPLTGHGLHVVGEVHGLENDRGVDEDDAGVSEC